MKVRMMIAGVAIAAGAAVANAQEFNFPLGGDQAVPANTSNATGAAQLLYDAGSETFDLDLMVFGIGLGDLRGAGPNNTPVHIHNAPRGVNGGIVIDIGNLGSFVQDGLGIRLQLDDVPIGSFESELFAGNLYVNIHTNQFPGGQIRGQIVPAPGALAMLGLGLIAARRRR
jgi:hypothetical protein